ncbi:ANTAR domain-containing protein [Rhodococcus jostii]|uniref:ANTAR domain-containing protein n=2 Tax=Rhodococcus jostii TaxID=132919 RepID=A0A1H5FBS8_RHOJO|nr:ANTAR domain-containing protein [Rhodococcus jostii]
MSRCGGADHGIEAVERALDALHRLLEGEAPRDALLERLCKWAVETFANAEIAGVVLCTDAMGNDAIACTNPRVPAIESAQMQTRQGPGRLAADTHTVLRGDFGDDTARWWPAFAAAAEAAVFETGSFLCAPLTIGDAAGSLTLYSPVAQAFSEFDAVLLRLYTNLITPTIQLAQGGREARAEIAGLTKAMQSRSVIEQAKGIVMATGGVSADDAFDFLVTHSQQRNIKLHRLAQELVDLTTGPAESGTHSTEPQVL